MNVNKDFYLPWEEREVSNQYKRLLHDIKNYGHYKGSIQGKRALTLLGPNPMRFNLKGGIPLITERSLLGKLKGIPLWQQAIGEILAFINGAHTKEELEDYGCHWWDKWATKEKCADFGLEEGDLGLGFYGEAFTRFPRLTGKTFNQIREVIKQIKNFPISRAHFITPWIPQYLIGKNRKTVVAPCHGWMYFEVYDGKISLCMTQRSADVPIGVPFNTLQYSVLLLMVAQITELEPCEFVHMFMDAHIYEDQMDAVDEILVRENRKFPIIKINPKVKDLFTFRIGDCTLEEYDPHPAINSIPVSI